MATINELFIKVINSGLEAATMIVEPKDKAMAYANLARALAMKAESSTVQELTEDIEDIPKGKEAIKETPKAKKETKAKEESKEESKKESKAKEVKKEEPKDAVKPKEDDSIDKEPEEKLKETPEEVELVEEWTEEMMEVKSEQMGTMQEYIDNYESEGLNEVVEMFSEGILKTLEDITPLNIDAFIAYMKALEASQE